MMGKGNMWDGVKDFIPENKADEDYKDRARRELYEEDRIGFGATDEHLRRGRMLIRERAQELREKEEYKRLKEKYGKVD